MSGWKHKEYLRKHGPIFVDRNRPNKFKEVCNKVKDIEDECFSEKRIERAKWQDELKIKFNNIERKYGVAKDDCIEEFIPFNKGDILLYKNEDEIYSYYKYCGVFNSQMLLMKISRSKDGKLVKNNLAFFNWTDYDNFKKADKFLGSKLYNYVKNTKESIHVSCKR